MAGRGAPLPSRSDLLPRDVERVVLIDDGPVPVPRTGDARPRLTGRVAIPNLRFKESLVDPALDAARKGERPRAAPEAAQADRGSGVQGVGRGGDSDDRGDPAGQGNGSTPAPVPPPPSQIDLLFTQMVADILAAKTRLPFAQGKGELREAAARREEEKASLAKFDREDLPTFQEGQDVLSFLIDFEQACKNLGAPQALFVRLLRPQATGQLAAFLGQRAGEDPQWGDLKRLVQRRFGYTPEGLRQDFRRMMRQPRENFSAFAARLEHAFEKWLYAAGAGSYAEVRQLLLCEQFLNLVPPEMKSALLGKHLTNLQELAFAADELWAFRAEERRQKAAAGKEGLEQHRKPEQFKKQDKASSGGTKYARPGEASQKPVASAPPIKCYSCGGNHLRRDCPQAGQSKQPSKSPAKPPKFSSFPDQQEVLQTDEEFQRDVSAQGFFHQRSAFQSPGP
nr:uncharacterized protein LOC110088043 [Pogona vitticeps]